MSSLRDQLLAKGLTDKQSVKKVHKQKKQKVKQAKNTRGELSATAKLAEQARADKVQRDKDLNRRRQLEVEKKAGLSQIKQLVEVSKLDRENADVAYSFTHGKKVKNIYVTVEQQKQLVRDQIAIVVVADENYELVPKVVAKKIAQRDSSCLIGNSEQNKDLAEENDPYADYQIPDDLIW